MKKFVGVTHCGGQQLFIPKRELLIFDQIAIIGLYEGIRWLRESIHSDPYIADELEWLLQQGMIFEPKKSIDPRMKKIKEFKYFFEMAAKNIKKYKKELLYYPTWITYENGKTKYIEPKLEPKKLKHKKISSFRKFLEYYEGMQLFLTRCICIQLAILDQIDAFPMIQIPDKIKHSIFSAKKSDVIQITLQNLPILDEKTPWEDIVEFREDPDTKSKFLALRNWMSEVARAKLSSSEIEEKIEWLLHKYQRIIEIHKLKFKKGVLETVITSGAEFIEDLIKLRFSKVAKQLFSIKRRKIELMEAEMKAPGREISYIIKAREKFSKNID